MGLAIATTLTDTRDSRDAAARIADALAAKVSRPHAVVCYATQHHDQPRLLAELASRIGAPVLGASMQGLISRNVVLEERPAAGAFAISGDQVRAHAACVEDLARDTRSKGAALGRAIVAGERESPRVVIVHYDPLTGANIDQFLAGLYEVVSCPVIGGAAGAKWEPMVETWQYYGDRVHQRAAVAIALYGAFDCELATTHGTKPIGIEMTVTKADGNKLLELDSRPALDVWQEMTGAGAPPHIDHTAAIAIGIRVPATESRGLYLVRDAFGADEGVRGVVLQAGIEVGTRVMLHHRTVRAALDGTRFMVRDLSAKLAGRRVHAVLGFECGARTLPFLGEFDTERENQILCDGFAPEVEILSPIVWGEVFPLRGAPAFFNYTYPVVAFSD